MADYYFQNDAYRDDKLAIYVLIELTDFGDEYYREIMGVSYDLECIEEMIAELRAKRSSDANAEYYVNRIRQRYEHIPGPSLRITEAVENTCYLIYKGISPDIVDEVLGYFGDRKDATEFAEGAMSYFETDNIFGIGGPLNIIYDPQLETEVGSWNPDEFEFIFE